MQERKLDMSANCLTDYQYGTWMRAGLLRTVNTERGKLIKKVGQSDCKRKYAEDNRIGAATQYKQKKNIENDVKKGILIPERDERGKENEKSGVNQKKKIIGEEW